MEQPIEFTRFVRPVCVPTTPVDDENHFENKLAYAGGWGKEFDGFKFGEYFSDQIKINTVQVYSKRKCTDIFYDKRRLDKCYKKNGELKTNLNKNCERKCVSERLPLCRKGFPKSIQNGFQTDVACAGNDFSESDIGCDGRQKSKISRKKTNQPYL